MVKINTMSRIFALNYKLDKTPEIVEITGGVYNMGRMQPSHQLNIEDFYFLNEERNPNDFIGGELKDFGGIACLICAPTCGEMKGKIYYFFGQMSMDELVVRIRQNFAFASICIMCNLGVDFRKLSDIVQ